MKPSSFIMAAVVILAAIRVDAHHSFGGTYN